MPQARLLKAYLLDVDDDMEIALTEAPEHTDHIDGDFMTMDSILAELDEVATGNS